MSKTKHTRGPWVADSRGLIYQESNNRGIARLVSDGCGYDSALIAAAPELLEALALAEKYIRAAVSEGALQNTALPVSNIQRFIEGVITKATGGSDE